jgi:hypothetical protein
MKANIYNSEQVLQETYEVGKYLRLAEEDQHVID